MKLKLIIGTIAMACATGLSGTAWSYGSDEVSMTCQRTGQGPKWGTSQCTCRAMNGYQISIISDKAMCPYRIKFNVKTMTWRTGY